MGKKKGGNSWLSAVKRAFRSPTKDSSVDKKPRREHDLEEDEEKKREKRRWLFRKQSQNGQQNEGKVNLADPKHAIAVAAATAAAAEAAVATAQAAVEIIRLTRTTNNNNTNTSFSTRQHNAAILIQTAFRGYLGRRALIALKGIVKLQALIRGQNVRKQAKMTLKCMQALLRVQARVREQRARLSHDGGGGRRSMFAESNNLWDSKHLHNVRDRKSRSRDGSSVTDDWKDCSRSLVELEQMLQARKEAAFKREKSLAHAFTQQVWDEMEERSDRELEETANWLDDWMSSNRGSIDRRDSIKTVEMDTAKPYYSNARRSQHSSPLHRQASPHHQRLSHYNYNNPTIQPPVTPPPCQPKPLYVHPTSPRKSQSTANTPSLRSTSRSNSMMPRYSTSGNEAASVPNYMAATESAKARIRSQSTPKQRPSTPERERAGSVKKRLSYPIPEPYSHNAAGAGYGYSQNLRSPSFKSLQAAYMGMEQQSNYSCYTDSLGGEISPCSTTDLRRWLR